MPKRDDDAGSELDIESLMKEQEAARKKPLELDFSELEDEEPDPDMAAAVGGGQRVGGKGLDGTEFLSREEKEALARQKRTPRVAPRPAELMEPIHKVKAGKGPVIAAAVVAVVVVAAGAGFFVWRSNQAQKASQAEIDRINAGDAARRQADEERLRKMSQQPQ